METLFLLIIILIFIGFILWIIGQFRTTKKKTHTKSKTGLIKNNHNNTQTVDIVDKVKILKKQKQYKEAIELLSKLVYEEEKFAKEKTKENNFIGIGA